MCNHFKIGSSSFSSAGFPLSPNSLVGDEKILTYHRYIEAAKFTNGQRSSISDPVFNEKKVLVPLFLR